MKTTGPRKPRRRAAATSEALAQTRENQKLIQESMKRWRDRNEFGRSKGLGLSEAELIEKVARETGATKTHIHHSLKQEN